MKRLKWLAIVVILGTGIALQAAAQQATTVLDIEPGVRMLGAGAAGISVADGAETLYYNPAGLAALPGISVSSFLSSYLGLASYSSVALTVRNFGLGLLLLDSTGIQGYDSEGNPTDDLAYRNTGIVLGAGFDPSDLPFLGGLSFDLSIGARVKFVSARVADERGSGFTFDLGFRTSFPQIGLGPLSLTDSAFGVTAVNLFGGVSYDGVQDGFPMDLKLGASTHLLDGSVLTAIDLDVNGAIQVGVVYSPVPTLDLRVGLVSGGTVSFTAGLGVDLDGLMIDYAFASHKLGATHRVSLTLDFASLDLGSMSSSLRNMIR